jgi:hypothetical protein
MNAFDIPSVVQTGRVSVAAGTGADPVGSAGSVYLATAPPPTSAAISAPNAVILLDEPAMLAKNPMIVLPVLGAGARRRLLAPMLRRADRADIRDPRERHP